ncbi:MAG: U32 family peptidase [Candidatus Paceibacterota bacterium]
MEKKKIELLAPAKNLAIGIIAVNAGADAVYIGAEKFGARADASNNLEDIKALIQYAHQFRVKVYVAFNTIIYDNELEQAKQLIQKIYEAKADGLIIQDMGILEMNLPPIPLIASTQMHNYDLAKIKFLEKIGFKRIILARELSEAQIKKIRQETKLELEAFVHGALCVSFSGRCYLSEALSNRSANRGQCIQACRLPYSLIDGNNNVLIKNKHLLCLKDLNLSENLEDLIKAGVTSFKIEGRLKDEDYVANVVYFYRKKIDEIIAKNNNLVKASEGIILSELNPDLAKTFNRGFIDYFFKKRNKNILAINSPKSIGKFIGKVKEISNQYFVLEGKEKINNGDGLCFFDKQDNLCGSNVNKVLGNKIFLNNKHSLFIGADVYRNFDIKFSQELASSGPKRKILIEMSIFESKNGFGLKAQDQKENKAIVELISEKQPAKNKETAEKIIISQLNKTGETIFIVSEIKIELSKPYFFKISFLNELRRKVLDLLAEERNKNYKQDSFVLSGNKQDFPQKELSYEFNIANKLANQFYKKHGVQKIEPAFELLKQRKEKKIMTTKHCLRHYLGHCLKEKNNQLKEPLYLVNERGQKFLLKFDCQNCQMEIYLF